MGTQKSPEQSSILPGEIQEETGRSLCYTPCMNTTLTAGSRGILHQTPVGPVGIVENGAAVTHIFFGRMAQPEQVPWEETPLLRQAAIQLDEYFRGSRNSFDLPLAPQGTDFEQAVWQALQTIPYGKTASYADIARQIGRPSACRAVGHANGRNPIGIVIPCHRVIGANGKLTGYAGGLTIKQYLLELEQGVLSPFMLLPDAERTLRAFPSQR